jgi:hypothetical protein
VRFLKSAKMLMSPAKASFAKRLAAKRIAMASNSLLAGVANSGTPEYALRRMGLESAEHLVSPEATLAALLEAMYARHRIEFYRQARAMARTAQEHQKCIQDLCAQIDYAYTGRVDAAVHLPDFESIRDYLRFVIAREHPRSHLARADLTDAFLDYAIEEAELVFYRS